MHFDHVPAGDHVPGSELLEHRAGEGTKVQGIDLDDVSRFLGPVIPGLADRIGAGPGAFAGGEAVAGRLFEEAPVLQTAQDPPHHRRGHRPAPASQEHHQLVLAPSGIPLPQGQHLQGQGSAPTSDAAPFEGAPALGAQALQTVVAERFLPPVQGAPRQSQDPAAPGPERPCCLTVCQQLTQRNRSCASGVREPRAVLASW